MTFVHWGRAGDLLFGLPTIRALGGGTLLVGPRPEMGFPVAVAEALLPLLRVQPYLKEVRLYQPGDQYDYDLWNHMRWRRLGNMNIAEMHLIACDDLNFQELTRPWSFHELDEPWIEPDRLCLNGPWVLEVAFCRNLAYATCPSFWPAVVARYRDRATFLGTPEEHADFQRLYGPVPYLPTEHFGQAARALATARLVVTNQSGLHAVAEALHRPIVLGVRPGDTNAAWFDRPGVLNVVRDEDLARLP